MEKEQQTTNPVLSGTMAGNLAGNSTTTCKNNGLNTFNFSSTTYEFGLWGTPYLIETREVGESVVMIYKQIRNTHIMIYPVPPQEHRVFKIVYSCKDGKWHKSEPIFGKIIPATEEWFDFDNED